MSEERIGNFTLILTIGCAIIVAIIFVSMMINSSNAEPRRRWQSGWRCITCYTSEGIKYRHNSVDDIFPCDSGNCLEQVLVKKRESLEDFKKRLREWNEK